MSTDLNRLHITCRLCGKWFTPFLDGASIKECADCLRLDLLDEDSYELSYEPSYAPKVWEKSTRKYEKNNF